MVAMAARNDFGAFLRARRERVTPADVGLPARGRRRTPGLRREELALLAGISVDYLVRLEQGREASPSVEVVRALADALGMNRDEAKHLWSLVVRTGKADWCPESLGIGSALEPATQALLDSLQPTPAFVIDPLTDVLGWNGAYERLMAPTGILDSRPPNLIRFTFTDRRARTLYREWEAIAREQAGNLRVFVSDSPADAAARALAGELLAQSADFARLWADYDVGEKRRGVKRLAHPMGGPLDLEYTALGLPEEGFRRLVTYLPADEATATVLDRLVAPAPPAEAPRLRVVESTA
jgi:transcriptional regulator with XRE-family HTH domain